MTKAFGGGRRARVCRAAARRCSVVAAVTVAATLLVASGCTFDNQEPATTLIVRDSRSGEHLHERAVLVGERFRLVHTHSVTGRHVEETFSVLDRVTIAMEELWFDRHGANLPTGPEMVGGVTTTYVEDNGAYRVLHHSRPVGVLPLIVGSEQVDHVLIFEDGQRLHLLHIADQWDQVEVVVDPDAGAAAGGR